MIFLLKHTLASAGVLSWPLCYLRRFRMRKLMDQAQRISYTMNIDFNAAQNTFSGYQRVDYNNNCS